MSTFKFDKLQTGRNVMCGKGFEDHYYLHDLRQIT